MKPALPFVLPDYWTPEQAFAVYELLDDMLDVIGDFYGVQLYEQFHQRRTVLADTSIIDDPLDQF